MLADERRARCPWIRETTLCLRFAAVRFNGSTVSTGSLGVVEREGSSGANAAIGRSHSPHRAAIDPLDESAERPLWSVMIPAYNCADHLGEAIESVLAQDYPRIEYLVVDGGSTDETLQILRRYEGRLSWSSAATRR